MIEVLKQSLEALERSVATCYDQYAHQQVMSQPNHFINQTITSLRKAIQEEALRNVQRIGQEIEQEPYGWVSQHTTKGMYEWQFNKRESSVYIDTAISIVPVYTHPPQRKCENCGEFGKCCIEAESQEPDKYEMDIECTKCGAKQSGVLTVNTRSPQEQRSCDKRTWVGLTEQEALDCFSPNPVTHSKNVEAKLKEKNT